MLFAQCLNSNHRIKPEFSGQKAKCELCNGELIAHCGEIKVWHWQHKSNKDCDSWSEGETEWHRQWKERFPEDWREVIIEREGQRHRADVKTILGLVIEFQNSPISSSIIEKREQFYGEMIWVINAQKIKFNFDLQKVTDSKAYDIEKSIDNEYGIFQDKILEQEWNLRNELSQINELIREVKADIAPIRKTLLLIKSFKKNPSDYVIDILERSEFDQMEEQQEESEYVSFLTNQIKDEHKSKYVETLNALSAIDLEKERILSYFNEILGYPIKKFNGNEYKVIPYNRIRPSSFAEINAVHKKNQNKIMSFDSAQAFLDVKVNFQDYFFIASPSDKLEQLSTRMQHLNALYTETQNHKEVIRITIVSELLEHFNNTDHLRTQLHAFESKLSDLKEKEAWQRKEVESFQKYRVQELANKAKELATLKRERLAKISKDFDGLYHFNWRHKRQTWESSKKQIYLDIGEFCLLEIHESELVKKVSLKQFMDRFTNQTNAVND